MQADGSDDFPAFNWVIFRFPPLIFQGFFLAQSTAQTRKTSQKMTLPKKTSRFQMASFGAIVGAPQQNSDQSVFHRNSMSIKQLDQYLQLVRTEGSDFDEVPGTRYRTQKSIDLKNGGLRGILKRYLRSMKPTSLWWRSPGKTGQQFNM